MASPASLAFASSLGQGFCRSSLVNRRNPSRQSRKRHLVLTTRAADYPTPDLDVPSNRNYQEAKALSKEAGGPADEELGDTAVVLPVSDKCIHGIRGGRQLNVRNARF